MQFKNQSKLVDNLKNCIENIELIPALWLVLRSSQDTTLFYIYNFKEKICVKLKAIKKKVFLKMFSVITLANSKRYFFSDKKTELLKYFDEATIDIFV